MSNRRKSGWERPSQSKHKGRGLSSIADVFRNGDRMDVSMPKDEKTVLKEVPAKIDGEIVGRAILFDDGSYDLVLNKNLSESAKAKISNTVTAFSEETGASFSISDVFGRMDL